MLTEVVWVTVILSTSNGKHTFLVSKDKPGEQGYADISNRLTPVDQFCKTYTDLYSYLRAFGFAPPPESYFSPTDTERQNQNATIIRRVPECNE